MKNAVYESRELIGHRLREVSRFHVEISEVDIVLGFAILLRSVFLAFIVLYIFPG